jgi:hypothetical protein
VERIRGLFCSDFMLQRIPDNLGDRGIALCAGVARKRERRVRCLLRPFCDSVPKKVYVRLQSTRVYRVFLDALVRNGW